MVGYFGNYMTTRRTNKSVVKFVLYRERGLSQNPYSPLIILIHKTTQEEIRSKITI